MSGRSLLIALALAGAACASPEAARVRGGGPGADVGNREEVVEFHAGAEPYYRTPCVVATEMPCQGPPPVFGTSPTLE